MKLELQANAAAREFQIGGDILSVTPYGSGHINDTYCVVLDQAGSDQAGSDQAGSDHAGSDHAGSHHAGSKARFILQRINTAIFPNPAALMHNIARVTEHVAAHLAGQPGSDRRVLTLIPSRSDQPFHRDAEGNCWRAYRFISDARTFDTVSSPAQAFQAAKAFGEFQRMLVDLPPPRLEDTLPGFHNTPARFQAFEAALARDAVHRAELARPEIEFAIAHRSLAGILLDAGLPERVIHNDTKFNNVLFDAPSGAGLCVVDLDTVMPGLALYDFGDMVRTATSPVDEDETDTSRVTMQLPMFEALLRGYLSAAGGFLTHAEKLRLVAAGKVITFEQGIRFLTDYLHGDTYYKVHRQSHNLDRCRTQFKLIQSLQQQEERMNRLVERVLNESSASLSQAAPG